jgi:hypothetical protein
MAPHQVQHALWVRLAGGKAGDAVRDGVGHRSRSHLMDVALQIEHLLGIRPTEVAFQGATRGERATFEAPVPFVHHSRGLEIFVRGGTQASDHRLEGKEGRNVLLQFGLIAFRPPDITAPGFDNLRRELALGKGRIAVNDFVP